MDWLKRNMFVAVAGAICLILLGLGGWWAYASLQRNRAVEDQLQQAKQTLQTLYRTRPFPHQTNILAMRNEVQELAQIAAGLRPYFTPVKVPLITSDADFKTLLDTTLAELHHKAKQSSVALPNDTYAFSFAAQTKLLSYAPGSYPILPMQLEEVRTICEILFDARINRLLHVRRVRATVDDPPSGPDYLGLSFRTNTFGTNLVLLKPYEFRFYCFTEELGTVLENLARSPHGFTVRAVAVRPAPEEPKPGKKKTPPPGGPRAPSRMRPGAPVPGAPRGRGVRPRGPAGRYPRRRAATAGPTSREPEIVLDEKRLEVTLFIDVITTTQR